MLSENEGRMTDSDRLLLFALESGRPDQIDALLAIARLKGVSLAELVEQAVNRGLAKELEDWEDY
jgi:hypothetical protein